MGWIMTKRVKVQDALIVQWSDRGHAKRPTIHLMTCSVGHFVVRTHEFLYFCGCLVTPLKMKWDSFVVATFACFWYNALLCQGFYLPGMAPQSFCSKDKVSMEYDCKVAIYKCSPLHASTSPVIPVFTC